MGLELRREVGAVNIFMALTAVIAFVLWGSGSLGGVCVHMCMHAHACTCVCTHMCVCLRADSKGEGTSHYPAARLYFHLHIVPKLIQFKTFRILS